MCKYKFFVYFIKLFYLIQSYQCNNDCSALILILSLERGDERLHRTCIPDIAKRERCRLAQILIEILEHFDQRRQRAKIADRSQRLSCETTQILVINLECGYEWFHSTRISDQSQCLGGEHAHNRVLSPE